MRAFIANAVETRGFQPVSGLRSGLSRSPGRRKTLPDPDVVSLDPVALARL
jgi:hypothetical protein